MLHNTDNHLCNRNELYRNHTFLPLFHLQNTAPCRSYNVTTQYYQSYKLMLLHVAVLLVVAGSINVNRNLAQTIGTPSIWSKPFPWHTCPEL